MPPVAVVTDTTAYLPDDIVDRHGIVRIPLYVMFGGDRTVKETEITDYPAFFEELRSSDSLPTTSQPSVGDFIACYEDLLAKGQDVVSIHISAGISGTSDSARQAAEQLEREGKGGERVRVIDSSTAAGGLALLVLAAAKGAERGESLDEIEERVHAGSRGTEDLVRDRHARVPQARGPDRSRQRLDRLDAEGEAHPHAGERSSRPWSACAPARARSSGWWTTPASATSRVRTGGWSSTSPPATRPPGSATAAARCSAAIPCSIGEIGPVLSAHTGPGLLGIGAIPLAYLE